MLVVIPDTPSGRAGTLLSALIVVSCAIGLTMHDDFYAGRRRRDFFYYYTNVSNLLVLVYFALIAPRLYASPALHPLIPHAEFAVAAMIMLTFCVFHTLLLPGLLAMVRAMTADSNSRTPLQMGRLIAAVLRDRESAILLLDNLLVHCVVPLLTLLYWLLCSPDKHCLTLADAAAWHLIPGLYLLAVLLRARRGVPLSGTESAYPYPFLDISAVGFRRAALCCSRVFLFSLFLSSAAVLSARFLFLY